MGTRVVVRSDSDRYLAPTSQFYFCGLPLRLDSYAGCGFGCSYCFAASRGGATGSNRGSFNPDQLSRRLDRLRSYPPRSVVDELLERRQPIHLGGMSDPLMPQEREQQVTLRVLRILAEHRYPAVISTKGILFQTAEYLDVLQHGNFLLQMSFSTLDAHLASALERGVPSPDDRLAALEVAASAGVPVAIRHQPVVPDREHEIGQMVAAASTAGARHYAIEFLKLGLEQRQRKSALLSHLADFDLVADDFAHRVGREWILNARYRLPWVLQARSQSHKAGLTFGAADTDLLPLSDGDVCCSGADIHLAEPGATFRHNYLTAIRAARNGVTDYSKIQGEWAPRRSVARFINSRSRIAGSSGAGIGDYVLRNWNGRANGPSPEMFHGVTRLEEPDSHGLARYSVESWLQNEMSERTREAAGP